MIQFNQVFSIKHLTKCAKLCCNGNRDKLSILAFEANIKNNIQLLHKELLNGTYEFQGFYSFLMMNGHKLRQIDSLLIRDKIVYKCICFYCLNDLLDKMFIDDNPAHRINKGLYYSILRIRKFLHCYYQLYGNKGYILRFDFKEFFLNINRNKLKQLLEKKLINKLDRKLIEFIKMLIDNFHYMKNNRGLGLGTEFSQLLSLFYINPLDHYIKEQLKIKYYLRYVDDGFILHNNYNYLLSIKREINQFIKLYSLQLNYKKSKILKLEEGFQFLNVKFNMNQQGKIKTQISEKSLNRFKQKLLQLSIKYQNNQISRKDINEIYQGWKNYLKNINDYNSFRKIDKYFKQLFL